MGRQLQLCSCMQNLGSLRQPCHALQPLGQRVHRMHFAIGLHLYLSASVGQQAIISAKVARPQPGHVQGELRCQTLPALHRIKHIQLSQLHVTYARSIVDAVCFACQVMIDAVYSPAR